MVTQRKGELVSMERKGDRIHLEFKIPSRGIIGLRSNLMTATAGEAIMAHLLLGLAWRGPIEKRKSYL